MALFYHFKKIIGFRDIESANKWMADYIEKWKKKSEEYWNQYYKMVAGEVKGIGKIHEVKL